MSNTFVQPGKVLTHSNSSGSGISAGDVVVIGDTVAIALVDIANGDEGSVSVAGVHSVTKAAGTAWNQGDKIDWDASTSAFDKGITAASGDVEDCGIAAADAGSADTTAQVLLTPGTGSFTA